MGMAADSFDDTLDELANVMVRNQGAGNAYGVSSPAFVQVAANVPVKTSLGKGRAKEFDAEKKIAINYREIHLRPWHDAQGKQLSHAHWLQINGVMHDVFQVDIVIEDGLEHHYEAWCKLVIP